MNLSKRKVIIFGLDAAPPELVFDKWLDDLPNIKTSCFKWYLRKTGKYDSRHHMSGMGINGYKH